MSTKKAKVAKEDVAETAPAVEGKVYTYVGGGEDSPRTINFMGQQKFIRGKATEVTHLDLLAKLENHPTFVEGEVDQDQLEESDSEAKAEADEQRAKDIKLNAAYTKKHKTE